MRSALLCAAESASQTPPLDVTRSLNSTGLFDTIDTKNCTDQTPTLAELMNYDSVMVWSRNPFANATLLGDVLADYVDSGRTVVASYTSFHQTWGVRGRLRDQNYIPFANVTTEYNNASFHLVAVNQPHPLLNGVNSFDGKI